MVTTREQMKDIVDDLKEKKAVDAAAIIRKDGALLASNFDKYTMPQEIFAMMGATILGAAKNITLKSDMGLPSRIIIETNDGDVIITGADTKAMVMCLVNEGMDQVLLSETLDAVVEKVQTLL
ncbi:MAG: roadblock/LC7 domain-containing protein [Thermoplasmata archaeon]|nr:MAG: roadblock/LC7 domain-containing protein [Thermoplasmata archaeon]